ncbi:S8 family serine peptidase [Spongiactinospora sp. TRM90649]|uniref:S8 family serine peptidase n=1 Tax=Spongiactinospora sp. TRM90649 TaxID=3031114 RepID=UPI0023F6F10D|nr:S8 family serine peptidase [Spongiactinospora sp. TRM90649]MDF5755584.1 S8 family serine peptidase [Spongiactinospora sp. TRM90649]
MSRFRSGGGRWALAALCLLAPAVRPQVPAERAVIVLLKDQPDPRGLAGYGGAAAERALRSHAERAQRDLLRLLAARRARAVEPLWILNGLAVTAGPSVLAELAARQDVGAIVPERVVRAPALAAGVAEAPPEPGVALTGAPELWRLGPRGRGAVVAALDTGVDASHPDLASRYRGRPHDWYDATGRHPSGPIDVSGHGTAVMGVMVAGEHGGTAVGMAPEAVWIAARIFNERGIATSAGILRAMQWALDPDGDPATPDRPDVLNNSWTASVTGCLPEFGLALRTLRAAGILPVFAAGNQGPDPGSVRAPADDPSAFAVGAADHADRIDEASGRGPSPCTGDVAPRLVAPGVNVRTTDLYGDYVIASGTSLAAPHVSGAVALLRGAFPGLGPGTLVTALEQGAAPLGPPGPDDDGGHGRLDVAAAYRWLGGEGRVR